MADPLLPARVRGRSADLPRRPLGAAGPGRRPAARRRLLRRGAARRCSRPARCPRSASSSVSLSPPLRYVVVPLAVAVLGHAGGAGRPRGAPVRVGLAAAAAARAAALRRAGRCRSRASRWRGTASSRVRWDGDGGAAASRPGARPGEGHVRRAGAARRTAAAGWSRAAEPDGRRAVRRWCCAAGRVLEVRP